MDLGKFSSVTGVLIGNTHNWKVNRDFVIPVHKCTDKKNHLYVSLMKLDI